MAYIEQGFLEELNTISPLANKIFPLVTFDKTLLPYGIYISSAPETEKALSGFLTKQETEIDLFIFHSNYEDLKDVMALVVAKVKTFIGRTLGTSGLLVQNVSYTSEPESYQAESDSCMGRIKIRLTY